MHWPFEDGLLQAGHKAFAQTAQVLRTLEAVAVALKQKEPVLLVGETGTGKSTLVQQIACQVALKMHLFQFEYHCIK